MKTCFVCLVQKDILCFYRNNLVSDGRSNKCIECTKTYLLNHRKNNINIFKEREKIKNRSEEHRSLVKEYIKTERGKERLRAAKLSWRKKNKIKTKAHSAVLRAIKNGSIIKEPCYICGEAAQAHHEDYNKPLAITWLCIFHHKERHIEIRDLRLYYHK